MSNPWIRGAPTVWPHGPGQSPDSLTALANGQALGMGKLWAENIGLDPSGRSDFATMESHDGIGKCRRHDIALPDRL